MAGDRVVIKIDGDDSGFKNAMSGLDTVAKAGLVALAAGITAISAALIKGTKDTMDYGDRVDKMSQKIGMSAKSFQEWDYIMKINGSSIDGLQMGMKTLSVAAENGSKEFSKLGITQKDLEKYSPEQLFERTVKELQGMEAGTERTAIATKLFGRSATELAPLLNSTAQETEALKDKANRLGMVMSDEAVKGSAKLTDSVTTLQGTFVGIRNEILSATFPSLTRLTDGFTKVLRSAEVKPAIEAAKNAMKSMSEEITKGLLKILPTLVKAMTGLIEALPTLTKLLLVGVAAWVAYKAAIAISNVIGAASAAMTSLNTAMTLAGVSTKITTVAQLAKVAADQAEAVSAGLATGALTAKNVILGVLTGQISLATAAQWLWNAAMNANPIGIVITALAALAGAFVLINSYMGESTKAAKELGESTNEIVASADNLVASIEDSNVAFKDNLDAIDQEARATEDLADQIYDLASQEDLSAGQKQKLKAMIDELNGKVEGLNLSYDEETGALSKSITATKDAIKVKREYAEVQARVAKNAEIVRQLIDAEDELKTVEDQLKVVREGLNKITYQNADGTIKVGESAWDAQNAEQALKDQEAELTAKREELTKTTADLTSKQQYNNDMLDVAAEKYNTSTAATEDNTAAIEEQLAVYEELAEKYGMTAEAFAAGMEQMGMSAEQYDSYLAGMVKATEDMVGQATNAFEAMSQNTVLSLDQIKENLNKNKEAVATWSSNLKTLSQAGVSEGFIAQLQQMGPAAADQTAAIVTELGLMKDGVALKWDELSDATKLKILELNFGMGDGVKTGIQAVADVYGQDTSVEDAIKNKTEVYKTTFGAGFQSPDFGASASKGLDTAAANVAGNTSVEKAIKAKTDSYSTTIGQGFSNPKFTQSGSKGVDSVATGININNKATVATQSMTTKATNAANTGFNAAAFTQSGTKGVDKISTGIDANKKVNESVTKLAKNATDIVNTKFMNAEFTQAASKGVTAMAQAVTSNTSLSSAVRGVVENARGAANGGQPPISRPEIG